MDKRVKYLIGLDTETCNGLSNGNSIDLSQSLVYDIGWVVCDKRGNVYKKRSFVVADTFCDMKQIMKSAYYAKKIPMYWEDIKTGKRILKSFMKIWKIFKEDMKEFNSKIVFAHNAHFDLTALNNTIRYITKSKFRFFFPYGTEIWDTLKMARQTIGTQKSYIAYCEKNGFMTKQEIPRARCTAEILHKYLTGNLDFEESHTSLEDVMIEKDILKQCFRQHKPMVKRLFA